MSQFVALLTYLQRMKTKDFVIYFIKIYDDYIYCVFWYTIHFWTNDRNSFPIIFKTNFKVFNWILVLIFLSNYFFRLSEADDPLYQLIRYFIHKSSFDLCFTHFLIFDSETFTINPIRKQFLKYLPLLGLESMLIIYQG